MTQKNVLVRLIDVEKNNRMIRGYWTSDISETYKLFHYMKDIEAPIEVCPEGENEREDEYTNEVFYIDEVTVRFGDNVHLTSIEVYVK